jgi:predicted ATPase/class 3 adenylate cyclase
MADAMVAARSRCRVVPLWTTRLRSVRVVTSRPACVAGHDHRVDLAPHGTVTFLFTDVEGSTGLWERDPAAMEHGLRLHDELLAAVVAEHGGVVFAQAGDSFAAAFSSPADAVAAAVEVQRGVASMAGSVTLRLRIGLHTGKAYERDGNYFGPVVNRAARLMATAHGGQVVCSVATAELARPSLGDDVRLCPLGTFRLKDLLMPEAVFQVEARGLTSRFPPLRTLDAARHNLPVQQTGLVGRDEELVVIIDALRRSRLVTVTGVGGCGKTRLALAVGAEVTPSFADGVFFVSLGSVTDGPGVLAAVTESLGVHLASETPSDLARFLERLDILLILDNCEHLLDDVVDLVDVVLSYRAGARILATSREALGAAGERVFRVPSLSIDADDHDLGPAVELLIERMRSAGAPPPGGDQHEVLRDICRRLDGIPLAIELAAVHLDQLSPCDLLDRLDHRFDLLVGGHGRRRQRQQTLQAVMDWSWELLSVDECRLLAIVSVFSGTWTLDSAEIVGRPHVTTRVARVLASLVAKCLVDPVFSPGQGRYRLLETVRLFAAAKLVDFGLAEEARSGHASLHLARARAVSVDQAFLDLDVMDRVRDEIADVGTAIEWLTSRHAWSDAAELVVLCGGCYMRSLSSRRGVGEVQLLEARVEGILRARLLITGAYAAVCTGQHDLTQLWRTETLRLADGHDAFATSQAAILEAAPRFLTDLPAATDFLLKADAVARDSGSRLLIGSVQLWLNMAHFCSPDIELPVVDERDVGAFGGPRSLGWAIARQVGALQLAEQGRRDEAIAMLHTLESRTASYDDDMYMVGVEALAGDPDVAVEHARAVMPDIDRLSDVVWHAELVVMLGIAHTRAHRSEQAVIYMEVAKRAPMTFPFFYALARRFGRVARSALEPADAAQAIQRAKQLTTEQLLDQDVRAPLPRTPSTGS